MGGPATFWRMDASSREIVEGAGKWMALVEEGSGYRVAVGTTEIDAADAKMISAAPDRPSHMIKVSRT